MSYPTNCAGEEGQRERERERALTLFDNSWLGLITINSESRVCYANRAAETFLNMSPGSLAGKCINEMPEIVKTVLLGKYEQVKSDRVHLKVEMLIPHGKRLRLNLYPDEQGVIVTIEDITREWVSEEVKRLAMLTFNSLPDAVFTASFNGIILSINERACNFTGYSREELRNMGISEVLIGLDVGEAANDKERLDIAKERVQELELQRKDGSTVPVEINVSMKSFFGVKQFLIIARDITVRKRAETEQKASKALAELYLDLMGHDIINMNQIALGYLEMAMNLPIDERRDEFLEPPIEVLQRSSQLIKDVRKLQKVKEGVFELHKIDLCKVLLDVQREFGAVPNKAITLNMDGCDQCHIRGNYLIHDVFANLVSNAIKHTGDRANITIALDTVNDYGGRYCQIIVEDNGPGIPDDFKGKIFNRMLQGTNKAKGIGIGLFIVKTLVDSFNGKVWVEDRVPYDHTQGAKFIVLLPAID